MRALLLCCLLLIVSVSANCDTFIDCKSCAGAKSWLSTCRWCPVDNKCHATGSLANPCKAEQNIVNPGFCPISPPPHVTGFDLSVAFRMLRYADAAYSESFSSLPPTFTKNCSFSFALPDGQSAFGYAGFEAASNNIVLAFRGTNTRTQLVDELLNKGGFPYPGMPGVMVNTYFLGAASVINTQVHACMTPLVHDHPNADVAVTGHSLGGAMAAITAFDLTHTGVIKSPLVYTFGQPRTGNPQFAAVFDSLIPRAYRVVNNRDVVPHLPTCLDVDGKCQTTDPTGKHPYISYHHGTEMWFAEGGYQAGVMCQYKECTGLPRGEDIGCSDGLMVKTSFEDHSGYWKALVGGWCGQVHLAAEADMSPSAVVRRLGKVVPLPRPEI